ncbi:MAG TPA: NUDIX domain-containing protein [Allosphingosinicella sp.]|nr:NUDIX domain-containing protein [Allosphingosinicella sp.]
MSLRRRLFTFLNGVRLALRKATGGGRSGVHAVPLTGAGKVVLVRLTYAPGWRVPGGGRKRGEAPEQAMLRELREEIGLVSHGAIEGLEKVRPGDRSSYFLVRDVVYRPRRSLEVEDVREFDPERLPDDTTGWTARLVELCTPARPPVMPPAAG